MKLRIKVKRESLAGYISILFYEAVLILGLFLFYFTTAIALAFLSLPVSYFLAMKWINYVWPPKQREEVQR